MSVVTKVCFGIFGIFAMDFLVRFAAVSAVVCFARFLSRLRPFARASKLDFPRPRWRFAAPRLACVFPAFSPTCMSQPPLSTGLPCLAPESPAVRLRPPSRQCYISVSGFTSPRLGMIPRSLDSATSSVDAQRDSTRQATTHGNGRHGRPDNTDKTTRQTPFISRQSIRAHVLIRSNTNVSIEPLRPPR